MARNNDSNIDRSDLLLVNTTLHFVPDSGPPLDGRSPGNVSPSLLPLCLVNPDVECGVKLLHLPSDDN